jgi:NTP pyrophosphatase (non-canonical NTP hydrolase)
MTFGEQIEICRKAIEVYGADKQKDMAIEEMSELIQAISKDKRGLNHNAEEEIADVVIMIRQMLFVYDEKEINKIVEKKLKRLNENLIENNFNTVIDEVQKKLSETIIKYKTPTLIVMNKDKLKKIKLSDKLTLNTSVSEVAKPQLFGIDIAIGFDDEIKVY